MEATEKLVIERRVPMPTVRRRGRWTRLLEKMEPGNSVLLNLKEEAKSLQINAHQHGFKMTTRMMEDGKYRVWLVEKIKNKAMEE